MIMSTTTSKHYASSSIGRVAVSKTVGWGFESLLACVSSRSDSLKKLHGYDISELNS